MKNIMVTCLLGMMCFQQVQGQGTLLRYAAKQEEQLNYKLASEAYVEAFGRRAGYASAKGAAESFTKMNDYRSSFRWWKEVLTFKEEFTQQDVIAALKAGYVLGRQEEISGMLEGSGLSMEEFMDLANLVEKQDEGDNYKLVYDEVYNSEGSDFMVTSDSRGNSYFVSDRSGAKEDVRLKPIRFDVMASPSHSDQYLWTGREYLKVYRRSSNGEISELKFADKGFLNVSDPWILEEGGQVFLIFSATLDGGSGKDLEHEPGLYYTVMDEEGNPGQVRAYEGNEPSSHGYISPFADPKEHLVYFSSNRPGGHGGYDLYSMTYTVSGEEIAFSEPKNLGPVVNTSGIEKDPFVSEGALYFSSDGHPRIGGLDIYKVDIQKDKVSGAVTNLGPSLNTTKDEFGFRKLRNGETYLSSSRMGEDGTDNIYKVFKTDKRIKVRLVDCYGKTLKNANVMLVDPKGIMRPMKADASGYFSATLDKKGDYSVRVQKDGFLNYEEKGISTASLDSGSISKEYKLNLTRLNYAEIIYYDLDKSQIKRTEGDILNAIAQLMAEYPELKLKVGSHTDSRATKNYNRKLSERRAEEVRDFLELRSISSDRVELDWFGEERLVGTCKSSDEVCHQLNRRSELLLYTGDGAGDDDCAYVTTVYGMLGDQYSAPLFSEGDGTGLGISQQMSLSRLIMIMDTNPGMEVEFTDSSGSDLFDGRSESVREFMDAREVSESRYRFDRNAEGIAGSGISEFEDGRKLRIKLQ